jgi:exopolyphosphatase/guanosine-5'-triphosphate,3'-diphosphate pyrophosphatase
LKLAAIDIGSNAIRLLISRVIPAGNAITFKKVEFIRAPIRLGDDVFQHGSIGEEKKRLLLDVMKAFKLIMGVHDVKDYRACATSAMRESSNGQELADLIQKETGIKLEIINGEQESALILKSLINYFPENGNYLNIDVGGGSTEMTLIIDHKPTISESFECGTVRMMEGKVDKDIFENMQEWVKEKTRKVGSLTAIGTGGNINKLCRLGGGGEGKPLSFEKLGKLYEQIVALPVKERIYDLRLNPDRADVIEHAAKIYLSIMKWARIDKIYCPNVGLKDGIISELWEKRIHKMDIATT